LRDACCVSRFTHYAIRTFWYLTTGIWRLATVFKYSHHARPADATNHENAV